jgi:hypothetical protein
MEEASMKTCFIIMPISTIEDSLEVYGGDIDHFGHVLECLFIPAVDACNLQPVLPKVSGSDIIHGEIIKNLSSADLVLCDISQLNPNVFFELGIRTSLNKPVTLVVDDTTKNIPFDTGIINYHKYNSSLKGWLIKDEIEKLSKHIKKTLESEPDKNSLWKYFGITQTGDLNANQITDEDKISLVLRKLNSIAELFNVRTYHSDLFSGEVFPTWREALRNLEKEYFRHLLSKVDGDKREAAKLSGMSISQFYEKYKNSIDSERNG